ncbi:ABC transporter substrate-binding protein [Glaciimonas sp. GG7]
MDQKANLQRRRILQATSALGMIGMLPGVWAQEFDWKRAAGKKLEVHLIKNPRGELLQKYEKEFEALTGITVGSEQVPEQQSRQKTVIEFNSGRTSFDVVHMSYQAQKKQFAKAKWLEDLRPYFAKAPSNFDFKDFSTGGIAYATQSDGRIDTLPLNLDPWILYYNKELFAANNIAVPKTFAELTNAAIKLHDPAKGVVGMVGRGVKNANVLLWTSFFLGYGGTFIDADGKLLTDSPAGIAAGKLYRDLLKNTGPAGVAGFNWNEAQSLFLQGRAAMWIDGSGFAPPLEDPTKSKVVGKVGYAEMPAGPAGQISGLTGDGLGVSTFSQNKDAAWLYTMWATGKVMQARMLSTGAGAPARSSPYANKEVVASQKLPAAWLAAVSGAIKRSTPILPIIEPVNEFRDVYGIALTNMLGGADVATELKRATLEFQPVLTKSGYKS